MYFLVFESSNFNTDMTKVLNMNIKEITTQKMKNQQSTVQNEAYETDTSK